MRECHLTGSSVTQAPPNGGQPATRVTDFALLMVELILITTTVRLFAIEQQRHFQIAEV